MKRRNKIIAIVTFLLLVLSTILIFTEYRIKCVRNELSTMAANSKASSAVTSGIDSALLNYKLNYSDIVSFGYDESGKIKSIETDIVVLNDLGNRIGDDIDKIINKVDVHELKIPLSVLLGGELTSGIGPCISVYITMSGVVVTKFENNFISAGVNQTRHQIIMNITVSTYVINGSKVKVIDYNSNVCIAESIIVGITPETFADFQNDVL